MSTATERARKSGSKRRSACTEKSGMKIQANMEHQFSVLRLELIAPRIAKVSGGYPAHAARLLKLVVDCTGLRPNLLSNRERNNSAVISNWSNNSECAG